MIYFQDFYLVFYFHEIILFVFCSRRKLIRAHKKNLSTILKQIINNELFGVRNPNNMPMMLLLFQAEPRQFAGNLAKIYLVNLSSEIR